MSKARRSEQGASQDVIHIVDENLRHGFAQLPRPVLRAKGLSDKAKLVYALLLDYAWREGSCFPGQLKLAEDLDTSDRTIRRALEELKGYKLVDWKQRGLSQTNVYFILSVTSNPRLAVGALLFEPDRTKMSGQGRTKRSGPDRTPVSDKEYTDQEYPAEEYEVISNKRKSNLFFSNQAGTRLSTSIRTQSSVDNVPAGGVAENDPSPPADPKRPSSIGQILAQRYPHGPAPTRSTATPGRGRPPKAPEFLAATMEEITHRLNDDPKNVRSNTTRATKLWKTSGLPEDKFVTSVLYKARSLAQQQGNVTKRAAAGAGGIINRVPYFFAVVEDLLGLKESAEDRS